MLHRLNSALSGTHGTRLRERILTQYPVILIDEFQDTSPLQYQIFDQIYRTQANDRHSALLLIGDPKQSIYGFRGADIYSYLQARRATTGRHYVLETKDELKQAAKRVRDATRKPRETSPESPDLSADDSQDTESTGDEIKALRKRVRTLEAENDVLRKQVLNLLAKRGP